MPRLDSQRVFGLHRVEWREVGEKPIEGAVWLRNRSCPRAGDKRWANINQPHQTPIGGRVWLLYQAALPYFNGVDQSNHQLDSWAIVECEITKQLHPQWSRIADDEFRAAHPDIVEAMRALEAQGAIFERVPVNEYQGWVKVVCHRVIALNEIPEHFPLGQGGSDIVEFTNSNSVAAQSESLLYLLDAPGAYNEIMEWGVVTKAPPRLVLWCVEVYGTEPFEICNLPLPDEWFG